MEIIEKSKRSVFIGNIAYDTTKDDLMQVFGRLGPVLSLRLVNSKSYAFCEYIDAETALASMRNLNGVVVNGKKLNVENAYTETARQEMTKLMQQQPDLNSPYGDKVPPELSAKIITNIVTSLPPERLLQITQEMQSVIRSNPDEAKHMLASNPQLAYALVQSQVVMGILRPSAVPVRLVHIRPASGNGKFVAV